jgi:Fe-S-cluster containining protein
MDSDLARLCQSCGLCCDGSLFGRVRLEPEEVEPARKMHLRVVESGRAFDQPCAALETDEGCRCSIYRERPLACRNFACRLYDRHRREGGPLEPRLASVRRVRELLACLEASSPRPGDSEDERAPEGHHAEGERAREAFSELLRRLDEDFARA